MWGCSTIGWIVGSSTSVRGCWKVLSQDFGSKERRRHLEENRSWKTEKRPRKKKINPKESKKAAKTCQIIGNENEVSKIISRSGINGPRKHGRNVFSPVLSIQSKRKKTSQENNRYSNNKEKAIWGARKRRVTLSRMVWVLNLIGWEGGASFLDQYIITQSTRHTIENIQIDLCPRDFFTFSG